MKSLLKAFLLLVGILIVAALGGIAYLRQAGLSARDEPGAVETFAAGTVRNLVIARRARALANPVAATPEALSEALVHFADHCAICHGNDGRGDTSIGKGLFPRPPDMRQTATQNLSDGELYYIIENGIRFTGMPAFGTAEHGDEEASWRLVHFIRHLPTITEAEIEEMESLNPVSPDEMRERLEAERFLESGAEPSNRTPSAPHKHP